ncbi:MAG: hypothetical protein ACHP9Y_05385 [Gammaproteobacteria bacterium]
MRILSFLLMSGLALPVFAGNMITEACCPSCQHWQYWDAYTNRVVYNPGEFPMENLLDCVVIQQRIVGL